MNNYFSFEQLYKAHLIANMTTVPTQNILVASDFRSSQNENQIVPSISITYGGDSINSETSVNCAHEVKQLWNIIIAVLDNADLDENHGLTKMGTIIPELLTNSIGTKLSKEHGRIKRESSPFEVTYDNELIYFPIQLSTTLVL